MTPDEKKAEEVLINFQKATQSWFRGESLDMDKRRETMINLLANALTEARQQVAKQKDERIARLEAQITLLNQQIESWQRSSTGWCEKHDAVKATNAEMEKRVKELEKQLDFVMDGATKLALKHGVIKCLEDKDAEISRLRAENARLAEAAIEKPPYKADLTARLSEALGALKKLREFGGSMVKLFDQYLIESKHPQIFTEADEVLNSTDNDRLLERDKALEETKKQYDEAMSICCEHFGFVKFGSVADCLKGLVERDKLRDAVIDASGKLESYLRVIWWKIECDSELVARHKKLEEAHKALEAHEKEGGV